MNTEPEASLSRRDGVTYRVMNAADAEQAARVLAVSFMRHEPLFTASSVSIDESLQFVNIFMPRMSRNGLSIVAVDDKTNEIVGVCINEDFHDTTEEATAVAALPAKWVPIFKLIDELEHVYKAHFDVGSHALPPKNQHFHWWMGGVHSDYQGRGILGECVRAMLELAAQKGFRAVFAETTGVFSRKTCLKHGFRELMTIPYASWEWRFGEFPFDKSPHPHTHASLMVKQLRVGAAPH